jgi:hypothetical protein
MLFLSLERNNDLPSEIVSQCHNIIFERQKTLMNKLNIVLVIFARIQYVNKKYEWVFQENHKLKMAILRLMLIRKKKYKY